METKEKYLEKAEIKVTNLISELYESESDTLDQISKTKEKMRNKLDDLKTHYTEIINQREELENKYRYLKEAGDAHWENAKKEFELTLQYVEGDKDTFIQKAETVLLEMGEDIYNLEEKAKEAASDVKKELNEYIDDLKNTREELKEKLENIKHDSSETWRDIKHWFIEKSRGIKQYFSNIGSKA